ncbi:hypothetical protein [Pseudomonas sp. CC6-YY-74]|nr:hypothetical protein [Pseudomonas sp. CC6-YY-74]
MARWLMMIGAALLLLGAVLHFTPWLLHWFAACRAISVSSRHAASDSLR